MCTKQSKEAKRCSEHCDEVERFTKHSNELKRCATKFRKAALCCCRRFSCSCFSGGRLPFLNCMMDMI